MDIKLPIGVRIERKDTTKESFSIKKSDIDKIEAVCLQKGEVPVFQVAFTDRAGNPVKTVCIVPNYFLEMVVELNEPAR